MPLTGTSKSTAPAKPTRRLDLQLILDQLDSEWATLKQDNPSLHGDDAGLLAYFHSCMRPALYWIAGDPYTFAFPEGYQSERLARLCDYLKGLQGAELETVKKARETNLGILRRSWPAYRDLAAPEMLENGQSALDLEVLPFTWEAIERMWSGDNWVGEGEKARTLFLPAFACKASADFHLAGLAVLFLNLQCRFGLTDLYPHNTTDGRN